MKGPRLLHIFAPASAFARPGFRFVNSVCEPPAAQSAAFEIRSGGMYAARLEALWASKSASPTADGKIEDFDAAPSERPRWPLPLSFSGRCRRQQENDATQENEVFIFLTACRLFRHAENTLAFREQNIRFRHLSGFKLGIRLDGRIAL